MKASKKILVVLIFIASTLIGLIVATQMYAYKADYSELLGLPIFDFASLKFYSPLMLISWAQSFEGYFPGATDWAFMSMLGAVGVGIGSALILNNSKVTSSYSDLYGSARWATKEEIEEAGLFQKSGVFLAHDGERYLRHDGPEHYAVIAPTRTGKGAGIIVPTLFSWTESAIVLDIKEENWGKTAGKRSQFGPVLYFNPSSLESIHYNPLWEIRRDHHEVEDVQGLVNMIVDPDGKGFSHDHWRLTGHELLVATILHLLYTGTPEQKSLNGIVRFLSRPDRTFSETLNEMLTYPHVMGEDGKMRPHINVAEPARSMLNKADNERSGVLSTAMSFLSIYRDPIIAANTAESEFAIEDLMSHEKPVTLYLVVSPKQLDRLRPLIRLMINQICHRLTESVYTAKKRRLLLMLDEFQTLGKLETFEKALGYIAGYGIKAMLICQSLQDLKKTYGERTSILDNTHIRVFYAPNTPETAKYISDSIGNTTVSYESESRSLKRGSLWAQSKNISTHFGARPLVATNEVMQFPKKEAIIFVGSSAPIKVQKIEYYKDKTFKADILSPPVLYRGGKKIYEHGIKMPTPSWLHSDPQGESAAPKSNSPFLVVERIEDLSTSENEKFYFDEEDDLPSLEFEEEEGTLPTADVDEDLISAFAEASGPQLYDDLYDVPVEELNSDWGNYSNGNGRKS